MGEYFLDGEVVRISFPDKEWVDVKEEFTQEDQDYILNRMAKAQAKGQEAQVEMNLGRLAMLERAIVAWSFSAELNAENISRLRNRYRSTVLEKVNALNEKATEFAKKSRRAST